ncbi:MAG: cyclic nucleotide-binding domain-containing protein [Spirochaetes bacterium]|nr:cyclic nucleotide-binding domain-containing protein [Spirochaetota bacterium]
MAVSESPNITTILRDVSFFRPFRDDRETMEKIASLCKTKLLKRGRVIIQEGDYGDDLYIIARGEIEIVKKTLQKDEYTVTTLDAESGSVYVGELALIDNEKRSATVVAKTDCHCLVIDRDDFIAFGNENPRVGLTITRMIAGQLSQKLRKANEDVITLFSALVDEISTTG